MGPVCKPDDDVFLNKGELTICKPASMCLAVDGKGASVVRCNDPSAKGWVSTNATAGAEGAPRVSFA